MSALAEAVRRHWPSYVATFGEHIPPAHVRAAQAILRCRTEEAGMVYFRCGDCGRMEASPVSCGHRACDACGQPKAHEWEARQKSRLLPVPYHMVTFTIPSEFRDLFRAHQRMCYDLFFRESAGALTDLAADPRHLGGAKERRAFSRRFVIARSAILTGRHSLRGKWRCRAGFDGGYKRAAPCALTESGWVRPKNPDYLVPPKPLAVRMRNRFRQALKAADFKLYLTIPQRAWQKPWNADTRPVGRGDTAFGYLARYVQKTALDAARILSVTDEGVAIRWSDRKSGEARTAMLTGDEFLRRFLQHVLPRGFTRVRHFGYLSAAARERYDRLRALLRAGSVKLLLPDSRSEAETDCLKRKFPP